MATPGISLILVGALLAGLVRGFSGFGTAMVFLPFAAQVYEPVWVLVVLLTIDILGPIPALPRAWPARDYLVAMSIETKMLPIWRGHLAG